MRRYIYPGTDMFCICFSCSLETSLRNVYSKWIVEINHLHPNSLIILICTKTDLRDDPIKRRELLVKRHRKPSSTEQGILLARRMGCFTYVEVGAINNSGMADLHQVMVRGINMWNDPAFKKKQKKSCYLQ